MDWSFHYLILPLNHVQKVLAFPKWTWISKTLIGNSEVLQLETILPILLSVCNDCRYFETTEQCWRHMHKFAAGHNEHECFCITFWFIKFTAVVQSFKKRNYLLIRNFISQCHNCKKNRNRLTYDNGHIFYQKHIFWVDCKNLLHLIK